MAKHKDKIDLIKETHPDLIINELRFIESGFHSLAIVVNGQFVFRFPLSREFFDEYVKENKILHIIRPYISAKIPQTTLYNKNGMIFTKHVLIDGIQFSKTKTLTPTQKNKLAEQIAQFLVQLHGIRSDKIDRTPFKIWEYIIYSDMDETLLHLPATFHEDFKKTVDLFYEQENTLQNSNQVVSHNDFNENNFLIDKAGTLQGVIDFGDAGKRDFSAEFAPLMKFDMDFTLNIVTRYEQLSNRKVNLMYAFLMQKIKCYAGMLELPEKQDIYKRWLEYLQTSFDM